LTPLWREMDWPHSPVHRLTSAGAYMVTAGTYLKQPIFSTGERLAFLCRTLFAVAEKHGCDLQAWAVFPNHYHFIASTPPDPRSLRTMLSHLHTETSAEVNRQNHTPERKVWFQYWDSHLTFPRSYFTRLSYVHQNAVRHGIVREASNYPWCSAGWLIRRAEPAFRKHVMSMKWDRVKVADDFVVTSDMFADGV